MATIYEGMYLLDNELVRESWDKAKAVVTDLIGKHGGSVKSARRWGERKLAYPIRRRQRATYLLVYYEMPREGLTGLVRDLDLAEPVLRYLQTRVDAMPSGETELAAAEQGAGFVLPVPPSDEVGTYHPLQTEGGQDEAEGSAGAAPVPEPAGEVAELTTADGRS